MSQKSPTKPNVLIPTTVEAAYENIKKLLSKAEGFKEQIAILERNKSRILGEKHLLSEIIEKGDNSRINSLQRKNKQIENIDSDIKKYKKYNEKIISEIEYSLSSLKENRNAYLLPKVPSKKPFKSRARGIKGKKGKKGKKTKTKKGKKTKTKKLKSN